MWLMSKMRTGEMPVLHEKYITGPADIPPVLLYDPTTQNARLLYPFLIWKEQDK